MNITVTRTDRCCNPPVLSAPPSKSDAHRRLILAALSETDTPVMLSMTGDSNADIDATVSCLGALGAEITKTARGFSVTPIPRHRHTADEVLLDVGESGSTLRFLIPVIGALGRRTDIRMHGRLPDRPLAPLDQLLTEHGMTLTRDPMDPGVLHIFGALSAGIYSINGGVSSQFITGLLFALPMLAGSSVLHITGHIASAPYIALTLSAASRFGFIPTVSEDGHRYDISPTAFHPDAAMEVEGDWSGGAFLLCAGAMANGVTVRGLRCDSVQGDRRIVEVLSQTGCRISQSRDGTEITVLPPKDHRLRAFSLSADDIPDLVPPMAALACACHGESVLSGCARLKLKESDRLSAVVQMIRDLGGCVTTDGTDRLTISSDGRLRGGKTPGQNDHRMVMSAALCALISDTPVTVTDREAIRKSYPGFFEDFSHFADTH